MSFYAFKFIQRLLTPVPINEPIAAGDRVDEALNKLQGQINGVGSGVPTIVRAGASFKIPVDQQALYSLPIELEAGAYLEIDGALVEID